MLTQNRGVWPAWLWMFVLALLLGWLPFIGPAIAGFVGGLQAGDVGSALVAAIIPSLIVAGLVFVFGTVLALPVIGVLVGAGVFMVLLLGTIPLLIGAWLGGMMASSRRVRPTAGVGEQRSCPNCGEPVGDTDTVCPHCGESLVGG